MRMVLRIIAAVAIFFCGVKFYEYVNRPFSPRSKESDLKTVTEGRGLREPTPVEEGTEVYKGNYVTFSYPARGVKTENQGTDRGVYERVKLLFDDPRINVVVGVTKPDGADLSDVPGVRMRRQNKDTYEEKTLVIGSENATVFSQKNGTEKVMFLLYQGRLYSLSVSGQNSKAVEKLWEWMLPEFHFR